jgi:signal transduction histidine kinase
MKQAQLERVSVRTALAIGFGVTLGLWLYTGFTFTQRIAAVQRDASDVAARYTRAQELLSTVRAQLLLSSVRIRDALLSAEAEAQPGYRELIEAGHRVVQMALMDYEPVLHAADDEGIHRLRDAVDQFHATSLGVLAGASGRPPAVIREALNENVAPRREAALAISEEIQTLNRRAFIAQQAEIAAIHRAAEARNRRQLGLALIAGLGTLLVTSLYAGRLESRLRHQMQRDARMSRELQETAAKIIAAQEEERRTIARDLHDHVGEVVSAIMVQLNVARRATVEGQPSRAAAALTEAQSITGGALRTVRSVSQLLHPAALDDLGLSAAIDSALRGLQRRHSIRAELHQIDMPDRLSREVELAAYRIVQEALNNVSRHAQATRCDVWLTHLTDRLLVEVEDNGVGFIEDHDRPIVARGLGLVSVRERAHRLGGTFNILSTPGQGTRLVVSLPDRGVLV